MKQLIVLLVLLFSFVCEGQAKTEDIDYKDIVEIKGLVYLKADTTLVTGKLIRYNKEKEAKKYILVSKGKPDESGWMDINNIKYIERLTTKPFFRQNSGVSSHNWRTGQYPYESNRKRINDENDRISRERDNPTTIEGEQDDKKIQFNSNNQLDDDEKSIENKKDGLWKEWYENGKLWSQGNYINGKKDGLWDEYYENGQLMSRFNYKEGNENGVIKVYHENGQLIMRGFLEDGIQIGEWKYYDEFGLLIKTENFD